MNIESHDRYHKVTIHPGEYYSTGGPAVISTLLGSCVATCLYDPKKKLIGMNHFMLSNPRYARDIPIHLSEAGRYGVQAMELLINDMMSKGTKRSHLRAKIFGGASILNNSATAGNFLCVGQVNCTFIRNYLATEGIPVDSEDLGGDFGRVIHFSNGDFSVLRRKINPNRSTRIAQRDRACWLAAIERQELSMPAIDLW